MRVGWLVTFLSGLRPGIKGCTSDCGPGTALFIVRDFHEYSKNPDTMRVRITHCTFSSNVQRKWVKPLPATPNERDNFFVMNKHVKNNLKPKEREKLEANLEKNALGI